ncbi:MAG: sigma-70 family RNA polymerase sigma factor [Planctomycetales bacterium]|nr:sigma-70 family RNA polymerase sigma factor [Planctomycetales bacterium]
MNNMPERVVVESLFRRYYRLTFRSARFVLRDSNLAEEAAHIVFRRLLNNPAQVLSPKTNVRAFLRKAARNAALDLLAKNRRAWRKSNQMDQIDSSPAPRPNISEEDRDAVKVAIAKLGRTDQRIVVMYFYDDKGYKAIAKALGMSEYKVKVRLKLALEELERHLRRDGFGD